MEFSLFDKTMLVLASSPEFFFLITIFCLFIAIDLKSNLIINILIFGFFIGSLRFGSTIYAEDLVCKDLLKLTQNQCVVKINSKTVEDYHFLIEISKDKQQSKIRRSVFSNKAEKVLTSSFVFIQIKRDSILNFFWLIEALNNGPKYKKITEEFLNGT